MHLYVSSACSQRKKIGDAVHELADYGFSRIELTGGTRYYPEYEQDLDTLREQYDLQYLAHNYFPPPEEDFVINLASDDDEIFAGSLKQLKRSLDFCRRFALPRFGFHAGFFAAPSIRSIGRKMEPQTLANQHICRQRFIEGVKALLEEADGITLYVENNVYSRDNYSVFGESLPFMGLRYADFETIATAAGCHILLDIAHLYVTASTLGFSFSEELLLFLEHTDYVHLSYNNGIADQNYGIENKGDVFPGLDIGMLQGKIVTLEMYQGLDVLWRSKQFLEALLQEKKPAELH